MDEGEERGRKLVLGMSRARLEHRLGGNGTEDPPHFLKCKASLGKGEIGKSSAGNLHNYVYI